MKDEPKALDIAKGKRKAKMKTYRVLWRKSPSGAEYLAIVKAASSLKARAVIKKRHGDKVITFVTEQNNAL